MKGFDMRSLVLIHYEQKREISIPEEIWDELEEQNMPGISLGKIRIYREKIEKKLGLATVYKGIGDKVDVVFESLLTAQYLLIEALEALNKSKPNSNNVDKQKYNHDIWIAVYYVLAKEFNTKNPVIDFNKNKIFKSI